MFPFLGADIAAWQWLIFTVGALLVAGVSWLDDLRSLSTRVRFAAHFIAALAVCLAFGAWSKIYLPAIGVFDLGWWGWPLTLLWIVGLTNAYNFMDGIDGIAGGHAVIAGLAWIILDEIQKLPILLDEVHRLMESRNLWFILTGSSARKLRRAGVNLLGGRAVTKHFHPLAAAELGGSFDFAKAVRFGLLPSIYDPDKHVPPDEYLQSYVQTYLKEEVIQEGLTRNLNSFSRFLETASFSQGQLLNISEVARECRIKRKLAESYFGILEDLLVGICLPPFQKRARRRIIQHPKFFLFDAGVFRALRPRGPLDAPAEIDGASLETLVFQHLRAILAWRNSDAIISYWRTSTGLEVDFVIYAADAFAAIEVKRKRSIAAHDLNGMRAFADEYPEAAKIVLYGGDHAETIAGIKLIPIAKALPVLEHIIWP